MTGPAFSPSATSIKPPNVIFRPTAPLTKEEPLGRRDTLREEVNGVWALMGESRREGEPGVGGAGVRRLERTLTGDRDGDKRSGEAG